MTIIYQILSFIVNLVSIVLIGMLMIMLPLSIGAPPLWLPTFMVASIVLYTWFSGRFRRKVLFMQKVVPNSLRDWIRVNGFVAIAFCILNIPTTIAVIASPQRFADTMKESLKQLGGQYEQNFRAENITVLSAVMLTYLTVLFIHILWTFSLIKKNRNYFQ